MTTFENLGKFSFPQKPQKGNREKIYTLFANYCYFNMNILANK